MKAEAFLIVIVDDDPSIRKGVSSLLRSAGYPVQAFEDASAFLAADVLPQADCLITDVQMPGMDGIALLHLVKRQRPALPVIVMTAFEDAATRGKAMAGGAGVLLGKPFNSEILLREIAVALGENPE